LKRAGGEKTRVPAEFKAISKTTIKKPVAGSKQVEKLIAKSPGKVPNQVASKNGGRVRPNPKRGD